MKTDSFKEIICLFLCITPYSIRLVSFTEIGLRFDPIPLFFKLQLNVFLYIYIKKEKE